MDSGDNFDSEKKIADPSGFQSSIPSSDWRYVGTNTTLPVTNPVASCNGDLIDPPPSAPESHFTIPWGCPNNPQPLCFCNIDLQTNASISNTATAAVIRSRFSLPDASGIASQSFHADSAIVERAAGFSCFNGFGFSNTVNQLGCQTIPNFMGGGTMQGSPRSFVADALKNVAGGLCKNNELKTSETRWCVENAGVEGRPLMNARKIADIARVNEEGDAEFSNSGDREDASMLDGPVGESSMASKKRKRESQADELNQAKGVPSQTTEPANCGGQNPASISNKCVGKQASGPPKQEYIHVRARRGQATNSHSLAERVRREKISERMKLLQDLLPGCSKVTGKAVMLDEIINYVQSLQRQVELLSMKLAAVNPQMDLSGDRHDAKDIIQPQVDLSLLGFSQDVAMNYAQSHPAQPRSIQSGPPDMGNPFDALQRTTTFDWRAMNGNFREPSQLLNSWDDELYNVFQMSFEAIAPSNSQDVKACLPLSQMKFEWQPT